MKHIRTRWQGEKLFRIASFSERLLKALDQESALLVYDFCPAVTAILTASTGIKHIVSFEIEDRYRPRHGDCERELNLLFKTDGYKDYRDMVAQAAQLQIVDAFELLNFLQNSGFYGGSISTAEDANAPGKEL